jgi:hypothetical protein
MLHCNAVISLPTLHCYCVDRRKIKADLKKRFLKKEKIKKVLPIGIAEFLQETESGKRSPKLRGLGILATE